MSKIEYTKLWLAEAKQKLVEDPLDDLHHFTHSSYSGGYDWNSQINDIYLKPKTSTERSFRKDVFNILLRAFQNVMERAETLPQQKWQTYECLAVPEAYHLAILIGMIDPLFAVQAKIRINKVCMRFGETLEEMVKRYT
jgi:hypothetical protein